LQKYRVILVNLKGRERNCQKSKPQNASKIGNMLVQIHLVTTHVHAYITLKVEKLSKINHMPREVELV
jgi:hypothetical protein